MPDKVGQWSEASNAVALALQGSYAYLACNDPTYAETLTIVDISDPETPTRAGVGAYPDAAFGVAVSGNYAYTAHVFDGLRIWDISNPASPVLLDEPGGALPALKVRISGDYAYTVGASLGIFDTSNPLSVSRVGRLTGVNGNDLAISGTHAYIAAGAAGLKVVDIVNPAAPSLAATLDTPGSALAVAVSGTHAYIADSPSGLQVVDISTPTAPVIVGTLATTLPTKGATANGDWLYLCAFGDTESAVYLVDVSTATAPALADTIETYGYAYASVVSGDYLFIADNTDFLVLSIADVASYSITATAGAHGTITPSGAVSVDYGEDQAFTITPDAGYKVSDVLVDDASVGAVTSYTFVAVDADHTIHAKFKGRFEEIRAVVTKGTEIRATVAQRRKIRAVVTKGTEIRAKVRINIKEHEA